MSLLTICQDAADEVGTVRPSTIIGNSDETARKLLRYANKVGKRLAKFAPWQALRRENTFTAVAGDEQTAIFTGVTDFDRFVPETFWDRTNKYLVSGPISALEWQSLKAQDYDDVGYKFIYRDGSVFFTPDADGGESMAYEYISTFWCTDTTGATGRVAFAVDSDIGVLNEELITYGVIYEFLAGDGLPAAAAKVQYDEFCDYLIGNDQPRPHLLTAGDIFEGRRRFTGEPAVSNRVRIF